ncbi:alkaline phosphatase [Reichenbachiella sp. MALMAid0571]|uniref:alkaline phosphatase n=1 Tax=Reichenbachiella sp. MALMAid0571 TaxID=3143939 RepID=UPI0032DFCB04
MDSNKIKLMLALVVSVWMATGCTTENKIVEEKAQQPKNIILLIGDGMGLSQVSTAFYFQDKKPNFQRFETVGLIRTSSSSHRITDSAAGATAFSAGVKTYNGAIGVDKDTASVATLVEIASEKGMKTGLIATSSITHATPASFFAHEKSRGMQDEIAAWMPESGVDYFAGGGLKYFADRKDGKDYIEKLTQNGFEMDTIGDGLDKALDKNKKYGFLLAKDGLPKMIDGRGDFLAKSTAQALEYLSGTEEGFFLMVEGSQIDWGGHANDGEYLVGEVLDFDQTLGVALDYAEKHGNTLVVVTADHETGGATLASGKITDDKGVEKTSYNKISLSFSTGGHSATLIPVFAHGVNSAQFTGIYENTEIFDKLLPYVKKGE